jgi:hypothetical protein
MSPSSSVRRNLRDQIAAAVDLAITFSLDFVMVSACDGHFAFISVLTEADWLWARDVMRRERRDAKLATTAKAKPAFALNALACHPGEKGGSRAPIRASLRNERDIAGVFFAFEEARRGGCGTLLLYERFDGDVSAYGEQQNSDDDLLDPP